MILLKTNTCHLVMIQELLFIGYTLEWKWLVIIVTVVETYFHLFSDMRGL